MNYKELVREAITLLDMYEPDKQCVNSFMEDSKKNLVNRPSAEQIFITDIVYGCIVHQKLLDTVINVFYDQEGKYFRRSHRNQFAVVTYLAMFHLEDLGLEAFSTIIKSLDRSKMHKFLSLFFNATNLTTWIHGEWCQLYEPSYVESKWIVPLLRWQTQMEDLLEYLEKKTTEGFQLKKFPKKSTEPQEFDLTRPKPRPLPAPELIPQQEKNKPKVLNEANTRLYRCANPEKSEKTKNILSQIQQARESELKFDSVFSSGMPSTLKKNTLPTRLNTTAILREGALYNRQLEEELNRLELLMQGASEPSAFLQWQKEMKEKDLQEELVQLECKRLEGKISYEEALLARQRVLKLNQHKALIKKEETTELMCRMKEEKQREQEKLRQKILQEKQKREKLVLEQLNTITACRTAAGLATARK
ncbi:cilia- and flagella-associated protein 99 [Silurus meridionalis]|nr:cilia- and flagella-associated protein 99 [Silurus meridionalis]